MYTETLAALNGRITHEDYQLAKIASFWKKTHKVATFSKFLLFQMRTWVFENESYLKKKAAKGIRPTRHDTLDELEYIIEIKLAVYEGGTGAPTVSRLSK